MVENQNAGHRLWQVQRAQGTGLCVGLDPHLSAKDGIGPEFYAGFSRSHVGHMLFDTARVVLRILAGNPLLRGGNPEKAARVIAGAGAYFLEVIDAAWDQGIRLFKPQAAFYEGFGMIGAGIILEAVCKRLDDRTLAELLRHFRILDAKRGDIDSTQTPYYRAYLTETSAELFDGMPGPFGFDAMTVTTWMGDDVLTPGLPFFRQGKGAIVVTRTSNPSGTTMQDMSAEAPLEDSLILSQKQEPFRPTQGMVDEVHNIIDDGREPMAHEVMLWLTEKFSRDNGLNQDGVSPIFSVMGSTVKMLDSFRKLRPGGIALCPGFGEQSRGQSSPFVNVMPLYVSEGPLKGHIGILASSRANNYPWMEKYGGKGDPKQLRGEMARMIDGFRNEEKAAYAAAGFDYPF